MTRSAIPGVLSAVGLLCLAPARLAAAVFVLANATADPVKITVIHPGREPVSAELGSGEVRPFHCGRRADVEFDRGGKPTVLRLDAYAAYVFVTKKGVTELLGIDTAGKPVPLDDVPAAPPAATGLNVTVKLLVDDADRRTRRAWEPAVRKRFAAAAEVLAAHCPVTFEVVAADEWPSDPAATDLPSLFADFTKVVKPAPARLAIGVTSRLPKGEGGGPFGHAGKEPLGTHVLVREAEPRTDPERVEVLVQQLGKYLGAVHSADPASAMRTKLGDGKATFARFRLGFDPLNTLVLNIWVEELAAGKAAGLADFRPAAKARLGRLYATLANGLPEETLPVEYAALAAKAEGKGGAAAEEPRVAAAPAPQDPPPVLEEKPRPAPPEPPPTRPERRLTPKQEAARKVVRAVVQRAEQNAAAATRLRGDELTESYIKTAADIARFEEKDIRPAAFLIGLGIALDDSEILRKNPLSGEFCKAVESDEERKTRLTVLGLPTVRNRRDLCQHFAVSAALTELVGGTLAEQAGLAKEIMDMRGPSGFSFTDLCADLSGIAFARLMKSDTDLLEQWWMAYRIDDFVPKMDGLRDGLSRERFEQDYGSVGDDRFKQAVEDVRKRVRGMKFYGKLDK